MRARPCLHHLNLPSPHRPGAHAQADAQLADRLESYVELDFGEITRQKAGLISRSERLSALLGEHTVGASRQTLWARETDICLHLRAALSDGRC
jgi:hypothetical protein